MEACEEVNNFVPARNQTLGRLKGSLVAIPTELLRVSPPFPPTCKAHLSYLHVMAAFCRQRLFTWSCFPIDIVAIERAYGRFLIDGPV
jgi:hypothetical protein